MIAVIHSGCSVSGAVGYNDSKVEEGTASVLGFVNFMVEPSDTVDAVALMNQLTSKNDRCRNNVFTCSLNPSYDDIVHSEDIAASNNLENKDELYLNMARDYMDGMGYAGQPFILYRHNDTDREHLHIVSVRIDVDGKKINDSNEKLRSERVRKEVGEKYGLSCDGESKGEEMMASSRENYIDKTRSEISYFSSPEVVESAGNDLKHKISNALLFVRENYNPQNLKEFNGILGQFNIACRKVEGINKEGEKFSGCQFSAIDDGGKITSHLIKGTSFGEKFSIKSLEKFFERNTEKSKIFEESRSFVRSSIDGIFKNPKKTEFSELVFELQKKGIHTNIVTSKDDSSKIIGVNFVDNVHGIVSNGSQIGKPYSYKNLVSNIEKHNEDVEKRAGYLTSELFKEAFKKVGNLYNAVRKENFKMESETVLNLDSMKSEFKNVLISELSLNEEQASRVVENFCKKKKEELPIIETNENSYVSSIILNAVKFSMRHLEDDSYRESFLLKSGISVIPSLNNSDIEFSFIDKPSVKLKVSDLCQMDFSDDPMLVEESVFPVEQQLLPSDLTFTKADRQYIRAVVTGDDKGIYGDFSNVVNLQKEAEKGSAVNHVALSKDNFTAAVKPFNSLYRELLRSGQYAYESELIKHTGSYEDQFVARISNKTGLTDLQSRYAFRLLAGKKTEILPEVEKKELDASVKRLATAVLFASHIPDVEQRTEFFSRMGVKPEFKNGELCFTKKDNLSYSVTWDELCRSDLRIVRDEPPYRQFVISSPNQNDKPFTKKQRDFVSTFVDGGWQSSKLDLGFETEALRYLDDNSHTSSVQSITASRVATVLNYNPSASADATLRALLYRGMVVKPSGDGSYRVGMHNEDESTYINLPKDVCRKLNEADFMAVAHSIEVMQDNRVFSSRKLRTLSDICKASDSASPEYLDKVIDRVGSFNPILADAMRRAAVPIPGTGIPDYDRVCRVVHEYNGERDIFIPPHTLESESFSLYSVSKEELQKVVSALENGTALSYLFDGSTGRGIDKGLKL